MVTSAWAAVNTTLIDGITLPSTPTGTYTGGTTVSHNGTNNAVVVDGDGNAVMQAIAPSYGSPTAANFTWTNAANGSDDASWSTTGTTWEAPGGSLFVGSTAYTTSGNAHYVNFARRGNLRNNRTFAYRFTNCGSISALVKSQGTSDDAAAVLAVYRVNGSELISAGSASSKTNAVDIITVDNLSSSETYVAFVYGMNGSNGELYEIAFLAPTTDPVINAANTSIATSTSGVDVTKDIDITGANLTANGTLTATLSPAVAGLSVALASNAIDASGAISTTATLTYNTTANAKGTTTLVLSDGTTVKNVTITYNSAVVSWTLQSISSATTWDWSKVTPNSSHALYKNNGIDLTNESDPDKNTEFVMENYAGGDLYTIADGFDGTTIAFKGEYPCRYGTVCQNGIVKFNTTVPGTIVVKFNDTGSGATATAVKRYLKVNGENTEYWTSRENNGTENPYAAQLNVVSGEIAVPAGDVTITGSSAIQIYYVTFTPTEQQVSTLSGRNYASYVTTQKLDFASAEGITAYIATGLNGAGDAVELQAVDVVPAGTPIIVKTTTQGATVNVPVTDAAADDVSGNALVAGDGTTAWNGTSGYNYYYLASDLFHLANAGTLQSGKAYLKVAETAAPVLNINFGETTGINAVNGAEFKVNGEYYNLAGQRVAQPTKGLYIINGRKVVIK